MRHGATHGWIEVVAGVMFSGKSEELIRRIRRALIAGRRVQLFKSHLDDRYGGQFQISSHDGRQVDAEPVSNSVQLAERVDAETQVVAIDEAQFLDDGICQVVEALADAAGRRADLVPVPRERLIELGGNIFEPPFYFAQYFDMPPITQNTVRAGQELGFEPTSWRKGLRRTFECYLSRERPVADFSFDDKVLSALS